jgi:hypothetical protein
MCAIGWGALHRGPHAFDGVTTAIARCIQPLPAASRSPTLLPGRETLLEGPVLGLPGLIEEKPADEAGSRPSSRTEPGVPADRAGDGTNAGTRGGACDRALLGWSHIGASGDRQSEGR